MVGGPPPTRVEPDRGGDVAVVLTGGGARAAYQVGFLRWIARHIPEVNFPIITGVSAGAINAAYLAAFPGTQAEAIERLATLWLNLSVDQVFRVDTSSLLGNMARWGVRLVSGGSALAPEVRGLVDTAPLWTSLAKVFKLSEGAIARGISHQLDARRLWALAIVTSNWFLTQMCARFSPQQVSHAVERGCGCARARESAVKSSIAQSTAACTGPAFGGGPARRQPVPPQGAEARAFTGQRTMNTRGTRPGLSPTFYRWAEPSLTVQPLGTGRPLVISAVYRGPDFPRACSSSPDTDGVLQPRKSMTMFDLLAMEPAKAAPIPERNPVNYATGQSVVWIQGRDLRDWERPTRREPNHRDRTRPCHGVGGVAALLPRGSPSGSMAWRRRYSSDRAVLTCHSPRGHSHPGALDSLCRIARGSRPTDDGGIPGTASDFRAVARRDLS